MSASLLELIRSGRLGDLQLGMTRDEVVSKLGRPANWSGKPPVIGPTVLVPEEANVWFYYNDAVGIRFDDREISISVSITPGDLDGTQHPFMDWPFDVEPRMSDFRGWLVENGVLFQAGTSEDEFYLLVEERCLVTCYPFEKGRLVPMHQRKISLISVLAGAESLPEFVRSGITL